MLQWIICFWHCGNTLGKVLYCFSILMPLCPVHNMRSLKRWFLYNANWESGLTILNLFNANTNCYSSSKGTNSILKYISSIVEIQYTTQCMNTFVSEQFAYNDFEQIITMLNHTKWREDRKSQTVNFFISTGTESILSVN